MTGMFIPNYVFRNPKVIAWLQQFNDNSLEQWIVTNVIDKVVTTACVLPPSIVSYGTPVPQVPQVAPIPRPDMTTIDTNVTLPVVVTTSDPNDMLHAFVKEAIVLTQDTNDIFDTTTLRVHLKNYLTQLGVTNANEFIHTHYKDRILVQELKSSLRGHAYRRSAIRYYESLDHYSKDINVDKYPIAQFLQDDGRAMIKINSHFNYARFKYGSSVTPSIVQIGDKHISTPEEALNRKRKRNIDKDITNTTKKQKTVHLDKNENNNEDDNDNDDDLGLLLEDEDEVSIAPAEEATSIPVVTPFTRIHEEDDSESSSEDDSNESTLLYRIDGHPTTGSMRPVQSLSARVRCAKNYT